MTAVHFVRPPSALTTSWRLWPLLINVALHSLKKRLPLNGLAIMLAPQLNWESRLIVYECNYQETGLVSSRLNGLGTLWKGGAENGSWHRRQENTENGLAHTATHRPRGRGDKSGWSHSVLRWLKWSATLVFLSIAQSAVAYLTACGLQSNLFIKGRPWHDRC